MDLNYVHGWFLFRAGDQLQCPISMKSKAIYGCGDVVTNKLESLGMGFNQYWPPPGKN